MKFTKTPPTTPGFYALKFDHSGIDAVQVKTNGAVLYCDDNSYSYPIPTNGEWCRLVPFHTMSEEVNEAWREGRDSSFSSMGIEADWTKSRAKQVAEGTI